MGHRLIQRYSWISSIYVDNFERISVDICEEFYPAGFAVGIRLGPVPYSSTDCLILTEQSSVVHTYFIIGSVLVLFCDDDLHVFRPSKNLTV